jgi:tRNA (uracil-5-)-methyltransferase TRM9
MDPATRDRLLALNRQFYAAVAEPFHCTRLGRPHGNVMLLDYLPPARPLRLLDAGCGNGRFGAILDSAGICAHYVGVDANPLLLELAHKLTADLAHVTTAFHQADLAQSGWPHFLGEPPPRFDVIVCLSVLQHMPGRDLRTRIVRSLAERLDSGGRLALSAWQFLNSPRLAARQIEWATAGVNEQDVEPGDALLPWKQDVYAVRYVHQIDLGEMQTLAHDAGLEIGHTFFADGKEGNLNLYAILEQASPSNHHRS